MTPQTTIETAAVPEHVLTKSVGEDGDANFEFTFRMDGTGSCRDVDFGGEPIQFTWELSEIEGIEGEQRCEALRNLAEELFWDQINDQLDDDRVLQSFDFGSEEVSFETGSKEELERLVRLVLYCFPSIWEQERSDIELTLCAATEWETADIDNYCELIEDPEISNQVKAVIRALVDYALGWNSPTGAHLEYNDGAAGRASGYSEIPNALSYSVPRPSFHELAEAREQLFAIFEDHEARTEAEKLLRAGE
ncbi:MAG: hypothetical protein WBW84_06895 [Acidobacteriaceae bacterium]